MFQRFGRVIREFFGCVGSQPVDAAAARAAQKQILEEQVAQFNRSLAASAGLCDLLGQQIGKLEEQEEALQTLLRTQAQAGGPGAEAGELAVRLHNLRSELTDLREHLKEAEAGCHHISAARDAVIAAARKKLAGGGVEG